MDRFRCHFIPIFLVKFDWFHFGPLTNEMKPILNRTLLYFSFHFWNSGGEDMFSEAAASSSDDDAKRRDASPLDDSSQEAPSRHSTADSKCGSLFLFFGLSFWQLDIDLKLFRYSIATLPHSIFDSYFRYGTFISTRSSSLWLWTSICITLTLILIRFVDFLPSFTEFSSLAAGLPGFPSMWLASPSFLTAMNRGSGFFFLFNARFYRNLPSFSSSYRRFACWFPRFVRRFLLVGG